jgi:hypothetical protein
LPPNGSAAEFYFWEHFHSRPPRAKGTPRTFPASANGLPLYCEHYAYWEASLTISLANSRANTAAIDGGQESCCNGYLQEVHDPAAVRNGASGCSLPMTLPSDPFDRRCTIRPKSTPSRAKYCNFRWKARKLLQWVCCVPYVVVFWARGRVGLWGGSHPMSYAAQVSSICEIRSQRASHAVKARTRYCCNRWTFE